MIDEERVKNLREWLEKFAMYWRGEAGPFAKGEEAEGDQDEEVILDSFDALPALQAEVERLRELDSDPVKVLAILMENGTLRAELAAARPVIEAARFVMERFINAVVSGGLTEKRAEALYVLHTSLAAFDYRQRTERAPAGHEKEKGEGE